MLKKIAILLTIFSFFTISYSLAWEVQVEGSPISFEVEPRIIQGQMYVPLYKFYQELGLNISFDDEKKTVTGEKYGLEIKTKLGSDIATINGNPNNMGGISLIISNRTMVPLNFVAQTFGYQVIWSNDLKVIYLRSFLIPYKDKAEANAQAAEFNSLDGPPKVSLSLREMEGEKDHYLNAGSSWKEKIFISEKEDLSLDGKKLEPSRFYTNNKHYAYFVLENTSQEDIETPFHVEFRVKQKLVTTVKIPGIKKGEKYEVKNLPLAGLTIGNNIIEVVIDPEKKLNREKEDKGYFYRIIYAYSTR